MCGLECLRLKCGYVRIGQLLVVNFSSEPNSFAYCTFIKLQWRKLPKLNKCSTPLISFNVLFTDYGVGSGHLTYSAHRQTLKLSDWTKVFGICELAQKVNLTVRTIHAYSVHTIVFSRQFFTFIWAFLLFRRPNIAIVPTFASHRIFSETWTYVKMK